MCIFQSVNNLFKFRATMLFNKCLPILSIFIIGLLYPATNVNALVEDVIDILHLGREVIKTISSTWELADQVGGISNDIDLPFLKRKEKKILSRMAELSQEFKNAEMQVRLIYPWKVPTITLICFFIEH